MSENTIVGKPTKTPEDSPGDAAADAAGSKKSTDADDAAHTDDSTAADGFDPVVEAAVEEGDVDTAVERSRLYALLALGFDRPGDDFGHALEEGAFCTDMVEAADAVDEDLAELSLSVGTHVTDVDTLHGEWASLFGVEEGVTVSPYELTYLPGPLVTTVRQLSDIAGFYGAFDLAVVPAENDRRDHVCFELEFLSHLSAREAMLRERGDTEGVAVVVDAQRSFLEDHLGRWYWRFADEVCTHGEGFYPALVEVMAAFVEGEVDRLELDPDWVPDDPDAAEWTEGIFGDAGRSCGGCGIDPGTLDTGADGLAVERNQLDALSDVDSMTDDDQ